MSVSLPSDWDPSPLPSTWDACDSWVVRLRDAVSSVPPLTGSSNYIPWSKDLQIVLSGVRGCLCLLVEPPASHILSTSLSVEIWSHLDANLAIALVGLLSPNLVPLFQDIVLDHRSRAARTLWLKLEADYGTCSSYDLWKSAVEVLTPQPQGPTPVTEFMTSRRQKFEAIKAAGYDFDRWFLDTLVADLGPHLGPTVRGLDFSSLTYDSLYAAVRGVDDNHRFHAASTSSRMALAASALAVSVTPDTASVDDPDPRPRGARRPLTKAEREWRERNGRCTYCNQQAHSVGQCPKIMGRKGRKNGRGKD